MSVLRRLLRTVFIIEIATKQAPNDKGNIEYRNGCGKVGEVVCGRKHMPKLSNSRVAGRATNAVTLLNEAPRDGVFTAATSDNEDLHLEWAILALRARIMVTC